MSNDPLDRLERSWVENAPAWTAAVRDRQIESRRVATDQAILQAVRERAPARVLDVGCGEGWLCRALAESGIEAVGIDASPPLIEAARAAGGTFEVMSYRELTADPDAVGSFDAVVCSFSLLEARVVPLLSALRERLRPGGALLVQTVHPWTARGEGEYRDEWRTETFSAFGGDFPREMPWYFRTLESWISALEQADFLVARVREPTHPERGNPLSLLLVAVPRTVRLR